MSKWAKNKIIANLEKNINRQIEGLIRQIENQSAGKTINEKAKELLLESLENMKLHS